MKPMVILQKRAIRIINKVDLYTHTNNLFYRNEILSLKDINFYNQAISMHKSDATIFQSRHSYNTRNGSNLNPTFQRITLTQKSLSFSTPTI